MNDIQYEVMQPLLGQICTNVYQSDYDGNDTVLFVLESGKTFALVHEQDCCECVVIESIVGDLNDLVGNPLLMSEMAYHSPEQKDYDDSETWSFFKFATIKGYVDIRFHGSSNGYYSESAYLREI